MPAATRRPAILALVGALLLVLAATPTAQARKAPRVSWVKCYRSCMDKSTVAPGGAVKIAGHRLPRHGRVMFRVHRSDGSHRRRSVKPSRGNASRLIARVPGNARSGRLFVLARSKRRSNRTRRLRIRKPPHSSTVSTAPPVAPPPSGTAFDGNAMWIWYVSKANGGDTGAIVDQANAHGITTVFVKSGDGTNFWSQFTPQLVNDLKAAGLRVCAWQYVYGTHPEDEAAVAARAAQTGADCFVIDAESEYEGRYAQAQSYVDTLRQAVGPDYPIGLAAFPYVDYHPSFPYSVFLGPNGAQFNQPQAYWKAIGGGVDAVVDHTYRYNRPYGRTIAPIGQTYGKVKSSEIVRFRQLAAWEGAAGLSWWEWSQTTPSGWNAVGQPIDPLAAGPAADFATIAKGKEGDIVLWAQQHLKGAGQSLALDGDFGSGTEAAVKSFQSGAGLPVTGQIDTATWQSLLQQPPAAAKWSARRTKPKSAKLPARRYEIPPSGGSRSGSGWHATP